MEGQTLLFHWLSMVCSLAADVISLEVAVYGVLSVTFMRLNFAKIKEKSGFPALSNLTPTQARTEYSTYCQLE